MRNGAYQTVNTHYTEDSANQITLTTPIASTSEEIIVYTIASAEAGSRAHNMAFHDDAPQILAAGQTYRNLQVAPVTTDILEIKAGTTVLADDWVNAIAYTVDNPIDITTTGANGLDAGSEASDTWYFVYAIKDPATGTVAGLLSTSMTTPTMPLGYTQKRLISAVYNDGGSNMRPFYQKDAQVYQAAEVVMWAPPPGPGWNPIDLSAAIPVPISGEYEFNIVVQDMGDPTDDVYMNLAADPAGIIGFQEHGMMDEISAISGPVPHQKWIAGTDSMMNIDGFVYFAAPTDPDILFLSIFGYELQI
jgi:hypothetical protein